MEQKKAFAVATAHLDTVWRWQLKKTIKEFIPSTLGSNFDLLEKYPHYKFNFEGAYRYEIIEHIYPRAFEIMSNYIRDDRWCISGTAYENGDVNIPSPEALIRNILLGDKYFKHKFDKSSKDIFLPDCFGFGWALPSVANHCGLLGFTTQKLSWGSASGLPFDLGRWVGPDGKEIFVCLNAKSYRYKFSGDIRADIGIINKVAENAATGNLPWANHLYGTGDWGGSPTEESVDAVNESVEKNSSSDFEVISAHSDDVFKEMSKLTKAQKDELPVWESELLMTSHGAGAYTSRCMSKRLNRQNEQLGLATEKSCVLANVFGDFEYPRTQLNDAWKRVIKHQFHDDITGTSNMEVYNDSWNDYYLSLSQFKNELLASSRVISNELDTSWVDENSVILMVTNPTQFKRKSVVEATIRTKVNCSNIAVYDKNGNETPSQVITKSGKNLTIAFIAELSSFEHKIYEIRNALKPCEIQTDIKATNHSVENSKYKVIFNKNGDIAYIYDKKLKKNIVDRPIKMALLHDTGSLAYPSWEITKHDIDKEPYCYANTPEFSLLENGPARASIKITREMEHSTIAQIVTLDSDGEYISVNNHVDWKTRRTLLKATFPTSAFNENATYDLGLGVIERGTNTDNLYEVPAQKWADITDRSGDFGVSIFSDCKYSWDKPNDNTLRLSCIHTPTGAFTKETRQDLQDLGRNIFAFAIYSHDGGFENGTQKYSELFANPIIAVQTDGIEKRSLDDSVSFASISNDNVIIRAIKMAEDDNAVIIRVNEANGKTHRNVSLKIFKEIGEAYEVNGLEEEIKKLKPKTHSISFNIKPFEVRTFKLVYKEQPKHKKRERFYITVLEDNTKGFSTYGSEMRHTILQGAGFSLPREIKPYKFKVGETMFMLPAEVKKGNDTFVCRGQTITVDKKATRVYFLAGSTLGVQDTYVMVGNRKVPLSIKPINEPLSRWDMAGLNQTAKVNTSERFGFEFPYTHHPEGINPEKAVFYVYSVKVRPGEKITLPENNRIVILAITSLKEDCRCSIASKIEDTVSKDYSFDDIPPIDKIIDKADAVTIRAGKIQDQRNSGKGKGFKRDNIVTNIIRSYTKSEW